MAITSEILKKTRLSKGMNQSEFADYLEINRSQYSRMENGGNISETMQAKLALKIHDESGLNTKEPEPTYRKAKAGLNTVSNYKSQIRALFASLADDYPQGQYDIWEVEGNSMLPTFKPGDKVLCRMITIDEIIDDRVYVLIVNKPELNDYRKSGIWVKRLRHRKGNGYINCMSDNIDTSEPFPTFRVRDSEINEVWYPVLRLTPDMSNPNKDIYDKLADLEGRLEMLEMMNE